MNIDLSREAFQAWLKSLPADRAFRQACPIGCVISEFLAEQTKMLASVGASAFHIYNPETGFREANGHLPTWAVLFIHRFDGGLHSVGWEPIPAPKALKILECMPYV